MGWIIGWSVFMGFGGYEYGGGIGAAVVSFTFWFLVLMAARVLIRNARTKQTDNPRDP